MLRAASLLSFVLLALPSAAFAQATTFKTADLVTSGTVDNQVNLTECNANQQLSIAWSLDQTPTSDQTVTVFTTSDSNCSTTNAISTLVDEAAPSGDQTTTFGVKSDLLQGDCSPVALKKLYVCLQLVTASTSKVTASVEIDVDTQPPAPPDKVSAQGGDTSLTVSWSYADSASVPSDLAGFRVGYHLASSTSTTDYVYASEVGASATSQRITGLTNGVDYEAFVEAQDNFGNWSDASSSVVGTPRASNDFWELYKQDGGKQGGCSSAAGPGGLALILVAIAFLFVRRRQAALRRGAILLLAVATLAPSIAHAQSWVDPTRHWFFETSFGPYKPSVDKEFGGNGPYSKVFGSKSALLGRFRFSRALWQGVGQIDLGIGAGFGQVVGKALYADGTPSPDTTVFNWVPLDLSLTYRLDYGALHWNIPFVPFVRAGLVYDLWWVLDGTGAVATDSKGNAAQGGRTGYLYGGGIMFLLDFLDPHLAIDFERSSGVDNSYIYFEWDQLVIDGFGSPGFNLSDGTWTAGLALEF